MSSNSRSRLTMTAEEKIRIYHDFTKSGLSLRKYAKKTKVNQSTMAKIKRHYESGKLKQCPSKRKRQRQSDYPELDRELLDWYNAHTDKDHRTSRAIRQKADELAANLGIEEWKCSEGWMDRWKKRNGITTNYSLSDVQTALLGWYMKLSTEYKKTTGTEALRVRAEQLADKLGHAEWTCEREWIEEWKSRNKITTDDTTKVQYRLITLVLT